MQPAKEIHSGNARKGGCKIQFPFIFLFFFTFFSVFLFFFVFHFFLERKETVACISRDVFVRWCTRMYAWLVTRLLESSTWNFYSIRVTSHHTFVPIASLLSITNTNLSNKSLVITPSYSTVYLPSTYASSIIISIVLQHEELLSHRYPLY